ncbi:MAG: hypothetical protein HC892_05335 [Saprospiraceae bacterium]|nr:hypothetical protein [Saprospiraceae bacterium]
MMNWENLIKTSILGISRAALPHELLVQMNALGMPTDEMTTEQILLESSALFAQAQKLKFPTTTWTETLPATAFLPTSSNYMPNDLAVCFKQLLLRYRLCLQEFSLEAQMQGLHLSPNLLPLALEVAVKYPETWDFVALLLDERGWWLIQQRKRWKKLANRPFKRVEITPDQRAQALETMKRMQSMLQQKAFVVQEQDWKDFHLAAYYLSPSEIAYWLDYWLQNNPYFDYRSRQIMFCTNVLDFRGDMIHTFHALAG